MKIQNRVEKKIASYKKDLTQGLNELNFFNCSKEELISSKKHYQYISSNYDSILTEEDVECYINILGKEQIKNLLLENLYDIDNIVYHFRNELTDLDFSISDLLNNKEHLPSLINYDSSYRFFSLLSNNNLKENNFDEVVIFLIEYIFINNNYWSTYSTFYDRLIKNDFFKRNNDILLNKLTQSINSQNIQYIFSMIVYNLEINDSSIVKEIYNLITLYEHEFPFFVRDCINNNICSEHRENNHDRVKYNLTLFYNYYLSLNQDKNIIIFSENVNYGQNIINIIFKEKLIEIYTKKYIIENIDSIDRGILKYLNNYDIITSDIYKSLIENKIENVFKIDLSYKSYEEYYIFTKDNVYLLLDIFLDKKYYMNYFESTIMTNILFITLKKFDKSELIYVLDKYFKPIFQHFGKTNYKIVNTDKDDYDKCSPNIKIEDEDYEEDIYSSKSTFIYLVEKFIINKLNIKQQYELITKYDYKLINSIKKPKITLLLKLASFDEEYFIKYLFLLKLNDYKNISYYKKEVNSKVIPNSKKIKLKKSR